MIAHRKIILRFGAVFLLVVLKIHDVGSRSITDNEHHQLQRTNITALTPSPDHSSPSELVPSSTVSNLSETTLESYYSTTSEHGFLLESPKDSNTSIPEEEHKNSSKDRLRTQESSFNNSLSSNNSSNAVPTSDSTVNDSKKLLELNVFKDQLNHELNHSMFGGLSNSSSNMRFESQDLFQNESLSDDIASLPLVESSNTTMGKEVIEDFGEHIKKLKENMNSFKDNLRKILFETESSVTPAIPGNHTVPTTSIPHEELQNSAKTNHGITNAAVPNDVNRNSSTAKFDQNSSKDVLDSNRPSGNKTSHVDSYFKTLKDKYLGTSKRPGSIEFSKISAVASNISEVSRRVGAFLQKQYWDSNSGNKERQQGQMASRGLENLVKGVEESEMPTSQVLQQWVNLEESFRESVDAVVRQALPLLVRASSEMQLSNGCYTSFFQLLLGLRRLRPWAFQMIDAFGKPPAGMLQGTVTSFGAYDECVNILAMSDAKKKIPAQQYFRGKYCTVEIKPPLPPKPQYYTMYQPVSILANFSNGDDNDIVAKRKKQEMDWLYWCKDRIQSNCHKTLVKLFVASLSSSVLA
ncbi:NRF domain-containing protein [Trichonephila clavata]|uniref:NRF domain-containing protein n=1 Tax=Trichonephila clavata TaxID=2740835 RepID=A0A8X6L720_TRICU|nr:NRF domain-containing protein [Trichonephila clavata]